MDTLTVILVFFWALLLLVWLPILVVSILKARRGTKSDDKSENK